MPNLRQLKLNLYAKSPLCHWCGCTTSKTGNGKQAATVDHIRSKPECKTHAEYVANENKVLACYGCNQQRNDHFIAANPLAKCTWKIRKRSPVAQVSLVQVIAAPATGLTHY